MTTSRLPRVTASRLAPMPRWALLQRQIFAVLDKAAIEFADRYTRDDGGDTPAHEPRTHPR